MKREIVERMKMILKREEELRKELEFNRENNIGVWETKINLNHVLSMKRELIETYGLRKGVI